MINQSRALEINSFCVFISFAYKDEDGVNDFRRKIKNLGNDFVFDDCSIKKAIKSNNENYIKRKIQDRINQASVAIVYLSPHACGSKWVNWEIEECLERGKGVIGIYTGDSCPADLPRAFKAYDLNVIKYSDKALMKAIEGARKTQ